MMIKSAHCRPIALVVLCMAVVSTGCFGSSTPLPESALTFQEVKHAAPVQALTLDGETFDISHYRGRPVLLHFWATWCFSCLSEMSSLERVKQDPALSDLVVLAVAADKTPGPVQRFMKRHGLSYPAVLDQSGSLQSAYRITSLPSSVFISRNGNVLMFPDPHSGKATIKLKGSRKWESVPARQVLNAFVKLRHPAQ